VDGIDREAQVQRARQALWDDLAAKARGLHCPEHFVGPWRVYVMGETSGTMRLQVSGCCPKLGEAVNAMLRADPRVAISR
jgi:hypothetical protein